jgi:uncharacterized membrane protein YagU involved in acid resistance
VRSVLAGGLLAGTLDILAAFGVYALRGVPPQRILQSIASGLLGSKAFAAGLPAAALGGLLHFLIAGGWALVYYLLSRRIPGLRRRPLIGGLLAGATVYFLMNLVVLPLSAFPNPAFRFDIVILLVHLFCVGLPISFAVRRYALDG